MRTLTSCSAMAHPRFAGGPFQRLTVVVPTTTCEGTDHGPGINGAHQATERATARGRGGDRCHIQRCLHAVRVATSAVHQVRQCRGCDAGSFCARGRSGGPPDADRFATAVCANPASSRCWRHFVAQSAARLRAASRASAMRGPLPCGLLKVGMSAQVVRRLPFHQPSAHLLGAQNHEHGRERPIRLDGQRTAHQHGKSARCHFRPPVRNPGRAITTGACGRSGRHPVRGTVRSRSNSTACGGSSPDRNHSGCTNRIPHQRNKRPIAEALSRELTSKGDQRISASLSRLSRRGLGLLLGAAIERGLHTVADGGGQGVRPLADRRRADADGFSGGLDATAQELECFGFLHARKLSALSEYCKACLAFREV